MQFAEDAAFCEIVYMMFEETSVELQMSLKRRELVHVEVEDTRLLLQTWLILHVTIQCCCISLMAG